MMHNSRSNDRITDGKASSLNEKALSIQMCSCIAQKKSCPKHERRMFFMI